MEDNKINYIYKFFNFLFNVLTYGWIAEIIMFILIMMALFLFGVMAINHKHFKYLMKDRNGFVRYYLYHFIRQKIFCNEKGSRKSFMDYIRFVSFRGIYFIFTNKICILVKYINNKHPRLLC